MAGDKRPDAAPELSAEGVKDRVWRAPGGDELAMRAAVGGTDADDDDHTDEVERETPGDTIKHISDPHIASPKSKTSEGEE